MTKQQATSRNRIIGIVFLLVMLINIVGDVYKTYTSKQQINTALNTNAKLKQESEDLKNEVSKLKDKNYIQSYASGTLFITEKDTNVYVLPKDKTPE